MATGDADGLGHVRKNELKNSAIQLGLRNESDIFVIDDPSRFPDSMTSSWSATSISSLLASAFAPDLSSSSNTSQSTAINRQKRSSNGSLTSNYSAPHATIDVLLTFDKSGVSNHPNHRSLYDGAHTFLQSLMKGKAGFECPVSMYTLTSTNMLRKYVGVLDAPVAMISGVMEGFFEKKKKKQKRGDAQLGNRLLYVSGVGGWLSALKAMVKGHQSQMVWFRWGWIGIGRYMVVNDLKREKV